MMRIRHIMHPRVVRIQPDASLAELIQMLAHERVSGVPVVEPDCHVVGVVSATDVLAAVAQQLETNGDAALTGLDTRKVKEIMTPVAFAVTPETTITEAARLLHQGKLHRALVIENGRLCGIVTAFDVLRAAAQTSAEP